jgi:tRNA (guanine-N7-)-methyltransferase
MTRGKSGTRSRHRMHGNPFNIRGPVDVPEWTARFGRTAPFALDIGFAQGAFLLELARRHPEWNVVGLEIRRHFVDDLNALAAAQGVANVHAVLANANVHLDELVPPRSLAFVSVNFPDPWFKKRHQKRRVVRPEWAAALSTRMAPAGELHAMTDYEPVAQEILAVMEATPGFVNLAGPGKLAAASTTGIESERERTHQRRGEPIYRLHFRFTGG